MSDKVKSYVNTFDETAQAPLPEVPQFPESQVTATATDAFEAWKCQVQMPELVLASDVVSDDSLDEFCRAGNAAHG